MLQSFAVVQHLNYTWMIDASQRLALRYKFLVGPAVVLQIAQDLDHHRFVVQLSIAREEYGAESAAAKFAFDQVAALELNAGAHRLKRYFGFGGLLVGHKAKCKSAEK